jgi:hypothetical protein
VLKKQLENKTISLKTTYMSHGKICRHPIAYGGYFNYLRKRNYTGNGITIFYGLVAISLLFLKITFPYASRKAIFGKDFWLDLFYFSIFSYYLILLIALSNVVEQFVNDILNIFWIRFIQLFSISSLSKPVALLLFFYH